MQNVDKAPYWAYQSAIRAAQDEEGKNPLMQEMQCRKRNIGTHSMRMLGAGKGKDADLGLTRMDPEQIKEARLSGIMVLSKRAGLLNSPL